MDNYLENSKVDPDYQSYTSAVELNEEEDKKENVNKIRKIIEEEYNREISQRQEQLEQIELQICKVRKVLHLLRYAVIMSYYNKKKDLEYNSESEATTSDKMFDKQNRIHPAVKKLLGKNVQSLDHLNVKDKRRKCLKNYAHLSHKGGAPEPPVIMPETKKIKLDTSQSRVDETPIFKHENNLEFMTSRKKTKYRLVVGNISKWMPSSEDNILTHKWMVYVRGPKEKPDVSHFVEKVVYYLHPSYKPHDVIEISESPFHLTHRGWGEFPIRVQIFFKVTLNKPIDVVHNLKLDKSYSGRQTLGNETILDVFLYDDKPGSGSETPRSEENFFDNDLLKSEIILEDSDLKTLLETSIEHDYCTENVENDASNMHFDHLYTLPATSEGLPKPKSEKIVQDETNPLIYGLESYCCDLIKENRKPSMIKKTIVSVQDLKNLIQLNRKDIKFNNTKIIVFSKKVDGSFLRNLGKLVPSSGEIVSTNKIDVKSFKVTLPKNRFKCIGEALTYLFKKLPLYSTLANNVNYKRLYSFTASSFKEFSSWNVGKRRNSEWARAKTIRKLLTAEGMHGIENWNTKAILMYGRSHHYTPYTSYGLFNRESEEKKLLGSCYANAGQITRPLRPSGLDDSDVIVNVDSDTVVISPKKTEPLIDVSDPKTRLECSYIKQTALDCGIILKSEEIVEGAKVNGAEMMILESIKCLAENLIRRAKNYKVCTSNFSPITPISKQDVEVAINERPEMFRLRQLIQGGINDPFM